MRKTNLQGRGSFGSKIIRALARVRASLELPLSSQEEKISGVSAHHARYHSHKEIRNAMLEVERLKAKAIRGIQRRRTRAL
jgi:hypothetical protein